MVNFMNDLCVRMMRAGARGLLNPPVPSSTWADGIQGLSPELVCANEQLHIVGTGFGSTQPPQVVVLIGDVPVTVLSWSNSEIVVVVPPGTRSGCVGFRNESLEAQRRNQLGKNREALNEVSEALGCFDVQPPLIPRELPWVGSRPPCTGLNRFAGTVPEIDSFRANGLSDLVVAPGTALTLTWEVQNATTIQILRVSGQAPPLDVTNPTGTSVALGPFTTNQPTDAVYELRATNRCGTVIAKVTIRLRKVPQLEIEGIEFTQAIQTFWEPGVADNSIPLVANKNTFVRVFVSVDMNGFMDDRLELTATLTFGPVTLLPINGIRELTTANLASRAGAENTITGRPRAKMQREDKDHSFNFLIPAAMCSGTRSAVFKVTAPPNETPSPGSTQVTPTVSAFPSCTWATKAAFKVRYVRVLGPGGIMMTDQEARECILRAIDLLPTLPSDIAPAWLAEWNTTVQNLDTKDGRHELLGHLDDQHDCTTSEWLFPWEEDCPDDDGAVWVGLSNEITGGSAESYQAFDVSRNTLVAKRDRLIVAHELGHTLKLNHVNPAMHCGSPPDPDDDFDTLPDDGRVQERDIFDPFTPYVSKHAAFDIMTYACTRWISRMNWLRMFAKF
jgi:hypothetical protein